MNRLVMPLATLAACALFCATATFWTVKLTASRQAPDDAATVAPPPSVQAASQLFGGDATQQARLRVAGVLSLGVGRGAAAIISENGAAGRAIGLNQAIDDQTILREVYADHIVVEQHGVRSDIRVTAPISGPGGIAYMR
ncbi:type II secretion system protein N [Robbsia sp. KACC 23696]|uniref:type II secretion system protein N n=1 Tax=Robbsia sp. KACC 23696 TaxID=3149231 RepID=UPI00325AAD93